MKSKQPGYTNGLLTRGILLRSCFWVSKLNAFFSIFFNLNHRIFCQVPVISMALESQRMKSKQLGYINYLLFKAMLMLWRIQVITYFLYWWYYFSCSYILFYYLTAVCYAEGYGVAKDLTKAARFYTLAVDQGSVVALNCLGELYQCIFQMQGSRVYLNDVVILIYR